MSKTPARRTAGLPADYPQFLAEVKARIAGARTRAALAVNSELVKLYWEIGHDILERDQREGWGSKVVERLAADLRRDFPDMTGLSRPNLHYMRSFAEVWPCQQGSQEIVKLPVGQLPWGQNITLHYTPSRRRQACATRQSSAREGCELLHVHVLNKYRPATLLVADTHALRGHLRRLGVAFGVIAAFVGWGAVGAPAALASAAHIYWSNAYGTTIGRSSPEGSEVDDELIKGASVPEGLAVVGQYVFWANEGGTTIGRASLEGAEVDQEFITGADQPSGLASYGGRLYWANLEANTIAEANLDGGEVDQEFIKGASEPAGVAVGGQYVYWSNFQTGAIGRANLDGGEVDQEFIKVLGEPDGLAVNGQYVYWSNFQTGAIGRANLQGTEVDQELIKGGRGPDGVAVDAQNIYWSNLQGDTIGRASLQGTEVDQEFITGAVGPGGLALAPAQPVALAAPSSGGVYAVGESVPTAFLCSEGALEPGLASCDDSNAIDTSTGGSGKLNTSTLGPHSYSVTASSTDGQSGLASIAYTVAAPPSVSISSPASGQVYTQGQLVTTKFACTEGSYGSGLASCNDSNAAATASGGSGHLSTAALGAHTYTVSALSKDAQSAGRIIAYTVVVAPKAAIETSRARVTNANMKLRVACRGATPSIACHGTLSLTIEVKRLVRRRVHGHLRTVPVTTTVVLAHKSYALPHGKQQTFALHLGKTGLEMLEHAPSHVLRVRARATVTDGDGTSRSISLER